MNANNLINQMSAAARAVYINERRRFDQKRTGTDSFYEPSAQWDGSVGPGHKGGKADKYGRNCKPVWPEIANFALRSDVSVEDLIRGVFASWVGMTAPTPNDCKTPRALAACKNREEKMGERVSNSLASEKTVASVEMYFRAVYVSRLGWTEDAVIDSVIGDLSLAMSPLFRVVLATEYKRQAMVELFLPPAIEQYRRARRFYDGSSWKTLIPDSVRQGADLIAGFATARPGG